jgi:hypothetical protein
MTKKTNGDIEYIEISAFVLKVVLLGFLSKPRSFALSNFEFAKAATIE